MPAYVIVEHIITDAAKLEEYRITAASLIARHGGHYLTKDNQQPLAQEPHRAVERVVVIEFPDVMALDGWLNSADYQTVKALRVDSTSHLDTMAILDGGSP